MFDSTQIIRPNQRCYPDAVIEYAIRSTKSKQNSAICRVLFLLVATDQPFSDLCKFDFVASITINYRFLRFSPDRISGWEHSVLIIVNMSSADRISELSGTVSKKDCI